MEEVLLNSLQGRIQDLSEGSSQFNSMRVKCARIFRTRPFLARLHVQGLVMRSETSNQPKLIFTKKRPIGSNKTCINAHAHTPLGARNTLTWLIRPN